MNYDIHVADNSEAPAVVVYRVDTGVTAAEFSIDILGSDIAWEQAEALVRALGIHETP